MSRNPLPFLRPYLYRAARPLKSEHARAYLAIRQRFTHSSVAQNFLGPHEPQKEDRLRRLSEVKSLDEYHPRLTYPAGSKSLSIPDFYAKYESIQETSSDVISVLGRIRSVRLLGSKLIFIDIERDTRRMQIMVELKKLTPGDGVEALYKSFKKLATKGDWIGVEGSPTLTSTGQLSVLARTVPQILAPCLHPIPDVVEDAETLTRKPHVHQLTSDEPGDILRLRALIYDYMRTHYIQSGFLEVETPIFDVHAGGAIARPFVTKLNEMANTSLRLRIAPELNLKRLIVGGQDKVFEMGRVFRNEGIDNTHNPEFSTCEFYEVGANLSSLIERTEHLVHGMHTAIESLRSTYFPTLAAPEDIDFSAPFDQLPFIPTIEEQSGRKLPDLTAADATENVVQFYKDLDIPLPENPSLTRLLDGLAEHYIEPLCKNPTFITHHPEALSPLSKSFVDPATSQKVAARVELFIQGREYINAYEEENSPFEQRRKFIQQLEHAPEGEGHLDESYLEVLEWGMPPTGGWGCGLDRLVMLFASKKRIADVLPFGTLRNVVGIAQNK